MVLVDVQAAWANSIFFSSLLSSSRVSTLALATCIARSVRFRTFPLWSCSPGYYITVCEFLRGYINQRMGSWLPFRIINIFSEHYLYHFMGKVLQQQRGIKHLGSEVSGACRYSSSSVKSLANNLHLSMLSSQYPPYIQSHSGTVRDA